MDDIIKGIIATILILFIILVGLIGFIAIKNTKEKQIMNDNSGFFYFSEKQRKNNICKKADYFFRTDTGLRMFSSKSQILKNYCIIDGVEYQYTEWTSIKKKEFIYDDMVFLGFGKFSRQER